MYYCWQKYYLGCLNGYELGEDKKCSTTKFCAESTNAKCISCIDNYYLGLDFNCCDVENCIYSDGSICKECKDNYYYNIKEKKCIVGEDNFKNCKSRDSFC